MGTWKNFCGWRTSRVLVSILLASGTFRTLLHPGTIFALESPASSPRGGQPWTAPQGRPGSQTILRLARQAMKAGDQKKALSILARLQKDDGESHFVAGEMLVEQKDYAAAARHFHLARPTYSNPYVAGYDETLAEINAGDYAAALKTANELLKEGHQTAELAELAATAYRKTGRTQEAYNALRLATHLDPKSEEGYLGLCDIALDGEKYDLGLQITDIGLTYLPGSEKLYLQRGVMRAMKGQFEEAEKDFSKASDLGPNDALPDIALGLIAMQMGNLDKSVEDLRRATHRHPDNYYAQYWLSNALERAGAAPDSKEGEERLRALEASVRLNPSYWHSRADLGKILLALGKVDRALAELQKAAALNPAATSPLYLLAQAYRRKGEDAKARDLMARVSQMQTEERDAMPQVTLRNIVREGTSAPPAGQDKH